MPRWLFLLLTPIWLCPSASADVKPHGLFTDHMVLQQGAKTPVWGLAEPGEKVTVTFQDQSATATADASGKWHTSLENLKPGGPFTMKVVGKNTVTLNDVLVGEVWICSGQSNMEWAVSQSSEPEKTISESANNQIRLFKHRLVTGSSPVSDVQTDGGWKNWRVCGPDSLPEFTAVGYHFGRKLQAERKVPIGLIQTAWGGTRAEAWTSKEFLEKTPEVAYCLPEFEKQLSTYNTNKEQMMKDYQVRLKDWEEASAKARAENKKAPNQPGPPDDPDKNPNAPCRLYNAMISPLVPFTVKGAIWYQGESNADKAFEYRTLFPTMIQSWRHAWGYDFPFLFVQLAPFRDINQQPQESDWAELREAQLLTTQKSAHTAMAVITDTTNPDTDQRDIHPKNKAPVGERLALAALQKVYGNKVVGCGPVYDSVKFDGDKAVLSFSSLGSGLMVKGDKLTGFTIAGKDKKFIVAEATIQDDKVVVSSPEVKEPLAVRFGWADYPVVNLFNKEGIPASTFRTDDWPGKTAPKRK